MGFRSFVQEKAQKLKLKGWVRNCSDGSVELEAFGGRKKLELFLRIIKEQHSFARVEITESKFTGKRCSEREFSIKF